MIPIKRFMTVFFFKDILAQTKQFPNNLCLNEAKHIFCYNSHQGLKDVDKDIIGTALSIYCMQIVS